MSNSEAIVPPSEQNAEKPQGEKPRLRKIRGIKRSTFAMPYLALSVIFVVVPLVIMLYYAFTDLNGGITFENFANFFNSGGKLFILFRSFAVALVTTLVCLVLAYPLALALSSSTLDKKAILVMLFVMPMWINSLLRTYAVKIVLAIFDVSNVGPAAWLPVTIGLVYDFFPFMLLPLYTSLSGLDRSLIEAAQDLGASPVKTLFEVRLPLSVPGIVSGVLMVFMPTVSTFAISDILGSLDTYMFGNIIDLWFRDRSGWNVGAAYSFILLALIAVTVFVANKITKGQNETGGVL